MKTLKIFSLLPLLMAFSIVSFAQNTTTESFPVSGNCGMCETKIEKAAKQAGASAADWNKDTKVLTVKYNSSTTNAAKVQQAIANVGYDTRDFKATDASYNKLSACCQYDREAAKEAKHQCTEKCDMKDGKCTNMESCKEKGCCKDAGSGKSMGCCTKEGTDAGGKMDCCKNGKCEKHSK